MGWTKDGFFFLVVFYGPLYLEVACSTLFVPEGCAVFLGDDFWICRIQLFAWFESGYMFTSVCADLGDFMNFCVKVDRIVILGSILDTRLCVSLLSLFGEFPTFS